MHGHRAAVDVLHTVRPLGRTVVPTVTVLKALPVVERIVRKYAHVLAVEPNGGRQRVGFGVRSCGGLGGKLILLVGVVDQIGHDGNHQPLKNRVRTARHHLFSQIQTPTAHRNRAVSAVLQLVFLVCHRVKRYPVRYFRVVLEQRRMRHRPRRILQDRVRRSSVGPQKDVVHQPMIKGAAARSACSQPKPKSVLTRPRRSHRHRSPTPPLRISPARSAPHHVPGTVCRIPKIHPKRIVRLRGVAQTAGLKEKSQHHIVPGPQIQIGRSQYVGERIGTQRSHLVRAAVGIDAVEHRLAHTAGLNRPCRSYLNFLVCPFP